MFSPPLQNTNSRLVQNYLKQVEQNKLVTFDLQRKTLPEQGFPNFPSLGS